MSIRRELRSRRVPRRSTSLVTSSGLASYGRSLCEPLATVWSIASGISTTIVFLAYFGTLEVASVVLVVPLFQLTPLVVVALSVLFLSRRFERMSWCIGVAAIVVVIGAAVVSVSN